MNHKFLITFFISFLLANIFFFSLEKTLAAECPEEGIEGVSFLLFKGPLVPCGLEKDCNSDGVDQTKPCTLCHFFILIENIFKLIFSLLLIVAFLMLTVSGVIYIVSSGNANMVSLAKGIITKTLTGFGLFLIGWLLIFTVLKLLSVNLENVDSNFNTAKWYEITCETENNNP